MNLVMAMLVEKIIQVSNFYSAYFPVLRCLVEVQQQLSEALVSHFESLKENNQPIPVPKSKLGYIDIQVEIQGS